MELAPRSRARGVRARELLPHSAAPPGAYAEEWRSYVQALVSDDTDDFQRRPYRYQISPYKTPVKSTSDPGSL